MGYHAAKLRRYNDLLEFYIYNNNLNVMSMLNTKYFIVEQQGQIFPYENEEANGNAWFISELEALKSSNEEIKALDSLDTKTKAVTTDFKTTKTFKVDSTARIALKTFQPNYLKYESHNNNDGFSVFSEVYYKNGWDAYINGKLVPHQRVNYALRGLEIPKGKHLIEFKFEPQLVTTGSNIALGSSVLVLVLMGLGLFYGFKKKSQ
jgi:uncharacterized membrane protein YfhO